MYIQDISNISYAVSLVWFCKICESQAVQLVQPLESEQVN